MNHLRNIYITVITAFMVFTLLQLTFTGFRVSGPCMTPNILNGDYIMVSKMAYALAQPERGDIIGFRAPDNPRINMMKRIIGLPGETIEIKDGTVFVNNEPLNEPYIAEAPLYTYSKAIIPLDNYFVLGDNRNYSTDSHTGYTVPRDAIIGKVAFSYWPPPEWGFVKHITLDKALGAQ